MLRLRINTALIRQLRLETGLSRVKAVEQSGIRYETLKKLEEEREYQATLNTLTRIASFYKVEPIDLLIQHED
jgi:transcriptional regulator with XRE-family HTH domain